jgi:hypothetical protein
LTWTVNFEFFLLLGKTFAAVMTTHSVMVNILCSDPAFSCRTQIWTAGWLRDTLEVQSNKIHSVSKRGDLFGLVGKNYDQS